METGTPTLKDGETVLAAPCIDVVAFGMKRPRAFEAEAFEGPFHWFATPEILGSKKLSFAVHAGPEARMPAPPAAQFALLGFDDPPCYVVRFALPPAGAHAPDELHHARAAAGGWVRPGSRGGGSRRDRVDERSNARGGEARRARAAGRPGWSPAIAVLAEDLELRFPEVNDAPRAELLAARHPLLLALASRTEDTAKAWQAEPQLPPLYSDVTLRGTPDEASLSALASARLVVVDAEPAWGAPILRHLTAHAALEDFTPSRAVRAIVCAPSMRFRCSIVQRRRRSLRGTRRRSVW